MLRWGIEIFKDYYFNDQQRPVCEEGIIDDHQQLSYVFRKPESVDYCFGKNNELFIATVVR